MFLKIVTGKVKFVSILNGEPVLIKVEKIESDGNVMTVHTGMFPESDYVEKQSKAKRGHIVGISNKFVFDTTESEEKHYSTIAVKLIKAQIIEKFDNINEVDVQILGDFEWSEQARSIRLSIPAIEVVENSDYNALINSIKGTAPYKQELDKYVVYLEEIFLQHRPMLEADENVIIEE